MQAESPFDKSVFCICCQSICIKLSLQHFISATSCIIAIIAAILNISYFSNTKNVPIGIHTAGMVLHFISLGSCLLMNSYIGRYISGYQNNRDTGPCIPRIYYPVTTYIVSITYWFFSMIYLAIIANSHNNNVDLQKIDPCSQGFIIYFLSSIILSYSTIVLKPIIPNLFYSLGIVSPKLYLNHDEKREENRKKYGCFSNMFISEMVYEQSSDIEENYIWSSASLAIIFSISMAFMNSSFAIYFNNRLYHDIMVGLTTFSTALSLILQTSIFISYYKSRNVLDKSTSTNIYPLLWLWIPIIIIWIIASTVVGFVYFPYDGNWTIDSNFVETSMQRNIFYLVQAFPIVPIMLSLIIAGIYYTGVGLRWCFCSQIASEIRSAQNRISGFTVIDETTKL